MSKGVMQMIMEARSRVGSAPPPRRPTGWPPAPLSWWTYATPPSGTMATSTGRCQHLEAVLEFFADPASPQHAEALDPDRPMIVVCHSGARAALAAATLQDMGFADVAILDGGLTAWLAAEYPVTEHEYAGI